MSEMRSTGTLALAALALAACGSGGLKVDASSDGGGDVS